nr:GGDEF domain-containing protein [uncultured Anaerosporobacter sp.]
MNLSFNSLCAENTMKILIDELKDINLMKNIFHVLRLVDVKHKRIIEDYYRKSCKPYIMEFDFNGHIEEYKKCYEIDCTTYKLEQFNHFLFFIAFLPVQIQNTRYVLECVSDITNSTESSHYFKILDDAYKLSITDELTGIYNRRYINHALPNAISTCSTGNKPLTVIFIDLDYFKEINDLYGHAAGDYLLSQLALDLQEHFIHQIDWVARYGGDEFLLCLSDTDCKKARTIAEQIRTVIEKKTYAYNSHPIHITCSLGVYTVDHPDSRTSYDSILQEVDNHLYQAKKAGRNQVSVR